MSDYDRLILDARKFAVQFKGLIDAAELLGKLGSLQNAEAEVKGRLETLNKQAADAEAAITGYKASGDKIIEDAKKQAADVVAQAELNAKNVLAKAFNDANDKINGAEKIKFDIEREAKSVQAAEKIKLDALKNETETLRQLKVNLRNAYDDLHQKYEFLKSAHDAFLAKIIK